MPAWCTCRHKNGTALLTPQKTGWQLCSGGLRNGKKLPSYYASATEQSTEFSDYDVPDLEYNLRWYQEEDGAQFWVCRRRIA